MLSTTYSSVPHMASGIGLLSNQGEKSINFYFTRVPLRKKVLKYGTPKPRFSLLGLCYMPSHHKNPKACASPQALRGLSLHRWQVDKNDIPVDPPRIALRSRARYRVLKPESYTLRALSLITFRAWLLAQEQLEGFRVSNIGAEILFW